MMNNNLIFIGPPGSGKTYNAKYEVVKAIWNNMSDAEKHAVNSRFYNPINFCNHTFEYVQENYSPTIRVLSLHDGMTTADILEGITVTVDNGISRFVYSEKVILELINEIENSKKPGFLILDDIHRVNVTGAFGELLFALSNRNKAISLPSGRILKVPKNLYVICTMNSIPSEHTVSLSSFKNFDIVYLDTQKALLEEALRDCFYKSGYFNVDTDLLNSLIKKQIEYNELITQMSLDCITYSICTEAEKLLEIDFSQYFNRAFVDHLLTLSFPLPIESNGSIPRGYKSKYNDILREFNKLLNGLFRQFSILVSSETIDMLDSLCEKVKKEYDYYNSFLNYISPEYSNEKNKYLIGYSYFIPNSMFCIWNAYEIILNKIRSQVIPLLQQYNHDGVIQANTLPDFDRTFTSYTRDIGKTQESAILIKPYIQYRDVFVNGYTSRTKLSNERDLVNASQKYNPTYSLLFEIVNDIVTNPLINRWSIMDMLCKDSTIYNRISPDNNFAVCLLAPSDISHGIVTAESDRTSGNQSLTFYRDDLHKILYNGKEYCLPSKIQFSSSNTYSATSDCRLKGPLTGRSGNVYYIIKALVDEYLKRFIFNLRQMLNHSTDSDDIKELKNDISLVERDIATLNGIKWEGIDADERRYNLLHEINNLNTWKGMKNGDMKGVYRVMNDKYQSIMDNTGIHQMILQGPPGTSKTYGAKEFLAKQSNIFKDGKWDDNELNAMQLLTKNDEYDLPEPRDKDVYWDIIQFHPSYTYEDFVRGISVSATDDNYIDVSGEVSEGNNVKYTIKMKQPIPVSYKTVNRTLGKMARIAQENYNKEHPELSKKFYLIIDEINRANLATVFGELIYALEYRNNDVTTPYSIYNSVKLRIPDNMYIIGTMNTADKSISSIDYAIRRRFLFFPVLPNIRVVYDTVAAEWDKSVELQLFYITTRLFDKYLNEDDYSKKDIQIGHTYFIRRNIPDSEEQMKNRFLYQVIPVLREYFNDGILTDEESGVSFTDKENICMDKIIEMLDKTDIDSLEKMYEDLIKELSDPMIVQTIKEELLRNNIVVS